MVQKQNNVTKDLVSFVLCWPWKDVRKQKKGYCFPARQLLSQCHDFLKFVPQIQLPIGWSWLPFIRDHLRLTCNFILFKTFFFKKHFKDSLWLKLELYLDKLGDKNEKKKIRDRFPAGILIIFKN